MRRILLCCLLSASMAFSGQAKPKEPTKSERAKATKLFDDADTAYKLQQYDKALASFQELYQLLGDPSLLFNIGQCYRQLGQLEEAKKAYASYLREAPKSPMAGKAEELVNEINDELTKRASKGAAEIETEQDPTEAFFDGEPKGSTPLVLSGLEPGEHKVLIKKQGFNDFEVVITIKPSETYELKVPTLTKEVSAKVIEIAQKQNRHRIFFIGAAGLGGLGAASAATSLSFLLAADKQQQDLTIDSTPGDSVISREEILAKQSDLDLQRRLGNTFGVSAIGLVTTAAISASIGFIVKQRASKHRGASDEKN